MPNVLQFTEPRTMSFDECVELFSIVPRLPLAKMVRDTMVCTINGDGIGACHGDSGMNENVLVLAYVRDFSILNDSFLS